MGRALFLLPLLVGGCLFKERQNTDVVAGYGASIHAVPGDIARGASADAMVGIGGIHVTAAAELIEAERTDDPRTARGGGLGIGLRASPIGMLAHEHQLERWLDGGLEIGGVAGGVAATSRRVDGYAYGWSGAWLEVGLVSVGDGYLAATGSARWVATEEPWIPRDQIVIGLAWRTRGPLGPIHD